MVVYLSSLYCVCIKYRICRNKVYIHYNNLARSTGESCKATLSADCT